MHLVLKESKIKNIENVTRCRDSRSAKSRETRHKTVQYTTPPCRVRLYTELFYAIIFNLVVILDENIPLGTKRLCSWSSWPCSGTTLLCGMMYDDH